MVNQHDKSCPRELYTNSKDSPNTNELKCIRVEAIWKLWLAMKGTLKHEQLWAVYLRSRQCQRAEFEDDLALACSSNHRWQMAVPSAIPWRERVHIQDQYSNLTWSNKQKIPFESIYPSCSGATAGLRPEPWSLWTVTLSSSCCQVPASEDNWQQINPLLGTIACSSRQRVGVIKFSAPKLGWVKTLVPSEPQNSW